LFCCCRDIIVQPQSVIFILLFLSRCFVRLFFGRDAYRLLPMEHVLRIAEVHAA
jgi:hypothetical protein